MCLESFYQYAPTCTGEILCHFYVPCAKNKAKIILEPGTARTKIFMAGPLFSKKLVRGPIFSMKKSVPDQNFQWTKISVTEPLYSSTELLQMLEAQKQEIEELQTKLWQQKSGYYNTSYVYV